jgi:hypothetical protein
VNNRPAPDKELPAPITEEESRLLERLRANPVVAAGFGAIMERFDHEVSAGMDAHQAENMVIEEIQQLGRSLLGQWAERTHEDSLEAARQNDPSLIDHGKKNSSGIPPSEPST